MKNIKKSIFTLLILFGATCISIAVIPDITNVGECKKQSPDKIRIYIEGENFLNVISVKFGLKEAINFTVISPTTIIATAYEETFITEAGYISNLVTVTTNEGTSSTNFFCIPTNEDL